MFTTGRLIFALSFVLVFVIGLVWSYRKDKAVNRIHFRQSYKVLIGILLFVSVLFLIVKMRKFL